MALRELNTLSTPVYLSLAAPNHRDVQDLSFPAPAGEDLEETDYDFLRGTDRRTFLHLYGVTFSVDTILSRIEQNLSAKLCGLKLLTGCHSQWVWILWKIVNSLAIL
jgi:hypothetical protein